MSSKVLRAERIIKGLSKDDFLSDETVKYACYASLIILSEAVARLSKEFKQKYENIEWDLIVGFRNIIVHEYFRVDWNIVWDVIEVNLPKLKKQLELD
ncbi:MAG: hypothetical protein BGO69_00270 [Bacteroidetes bacterium 46-16]|nr:MAG: hypothetical protein BGO69_00270 [Bacteroidetes bacterium 46-16]